MDKAVSDRQSDQQARLDGMEPPPTVAMLRLMVDEAEDQMYIKLGTFVRAEQHLAALRASLRRATR